MTAPRKLDRDAPGLPVAVFAHQDVAVGDQRALRVGGERRPAEHLTVRKLNDQQRDRVLVLERNGAVIHRHRPREAALARLRHVQRRPEPRDGAGVAARARGCQLGPQPRDFRLRLAQGVPHARELALEPREQPLRFRLQAVRPRLEPGHVARVTRALPLQRPESGEHHDEQHDQQLGPAVEARHLRRNPQGGARAPGSKHGHPSVRHRVDRRLARQDVELQGGPVLAETDDVPVRQQDVARDPGAVHEGAVRAAQVAHDEGLAVAHDPRVA